MFNLVLFEPEIPPNTGNIIRLAANTGCALHLIEPLGFVMEDKALRRAGLDYHEWARVNLHPDYATFLAKEQPERLWALTTKGQASFFDGVYQEGDYFMLGPESRGLPPHVLDSLSLEHKRRLPMGPQSRSLNLSNTAAIVVYEVWRQLGFPGGR